MDSRELMALVSQLSAIASIYAPGNAKAVIELLNVAARLNNMIAMIRESDPAAWAEIRGNYSDALARFEASVQAKEGE